MPDAPSPQSPSSDGDTDVTREAPLPSPHSKRRSHHTVPPVTAMLAGPEGLASIRRTLGNTAMDAVNNSRIAHSALGAGSIAAALQDAQSTLGAIATNFPRMDTYAEVPLLDIRPSPVVGAAVDTARATEALLRVSQDQQVALTGLLVETRAASKKGDRRFWRLVLPLSVLTLLVALAAVLVPLFNH